VPRLATFGVSGGGLYCWTRLKSISTNGANRPTQRPRVRNVYRLHWLSKQTAKTKRVTSQCFAGLGAFCGGSLLWRPAIQKCPTENLQGWQLVTRLSERHGPRISLVIVVRTRNQGLAKPLRASPNRNVWSRAAVQAPKQERSCEASTRCVRGLNNINRSIYWSSHARHTLVLEKIPATSAPTVQTAKRCHVWLFVRLEPLVEML